MDMITLEQSEISKLSKTNGDTKTVIELNEFRILSLMESL